MNAIGGSSIKTRYPYQIPNCLIVVDEINQIWKFFDVTILRQKDVQVARDFVLSLHHVPDESAGDGSTKVIGRYKRLRYAPAFAVISHRLTAVEVLTVSTSR
eukprot:UN06137